MVEFAFVAMIFFTVVMALIEYGLFMMTQVSLQSIVTQAGRFASVTTADAASIAALGASCTVGDRPCITQAYIRQKAQGLMNYNGISFTTAVADGTGSFVGSPFAGDLCLGTSPHIGGACPVGTPWQLMTGHVDPPGCPGPDHCYNSGPSTPSVGAAGQLIKITVLYPWTPMTPMSGLFLGTAGSDLFVIQATTIVKNES